MPLRWRRSVARDRAARACSAPSGATPYCRVSFPSRPVRDRGGPPWRVARASSIRPPPTPFRRRGWSTTWRGSRSDIHVAAGATGVRDGAAPAGRRRALERLRVKAGGSALVFLSSNAAPGPVASMPLAGADGASAVGLPPLGPGSSPGAGARAYALVERGTWTAAAAHRASFARAILSSPSVPRWLVRVSRPAAKTSQLIAAARPRVVANKPAPAREAALWALSDAAKPQRAAPADIDRGAR